MRTTMSIPGASCFGGINLRKAKVAEPSLRQVINPIFSDSLPRLTTEAAYKQLLAQQQKLIWRKPKPTGNKYHDSRKLQEKFEALPRAMVFSELFDIGHVENSFRRLSGSSGLRVADLKSLKDAKHDPAKSWVNIATSNYNNNLGVIIISRNGFKDRRDALFTNKKRDYNPESIYQSFIAYRDKSGKKIITGFDHLTGKHIQPPPGGDWLHEELEDFHCSHYDEFEREDLQKEAQKSVAHAGHQQLASTFKARELKAYNSILDRVREASKPREASSNSESSLTLAEKEIHQEKTQRSPVKVVQEQFASMLSARKPQAFDPILRRIHKTQKPLEAFQNSKSLSKL